MKVSVTEKEKFKAKLIGDADPVLIAKFRAYLANNPHVYPMFEKYVGIAMRAGKKKYSPWVIVNRMRWDFEIETKGDIFRISNDYIGLLSRLYVWNHPDKESFFDFKQMKPMRALISGQRRHEVLEELRND